MDLADLQFVSRGAAAAALALASAVTPAVAQDVSESRAWQFETPQEVAARAAVLDLIARQRGGVYAAPVYNTTIARQYNCSLSAAATGNSGAQSAIANSPTVTGAAAAANGNAGSSQVMGDTGRVDAALEQSNEGSVGSTATGSTGAALEGDAHQALNAFQTNRGTQTASVQHSSACGFGALN